MTDPVEIPIPELEALSNGERVYLEGDDLVCENQCGHDSTTVDLKVLVTWLRTNRPDLLELA